MENGPFIEGLWWFTYPKWWFSIATLNNQMVFAADLDLEPVPMSLISGPALRCPASHKTYPPRRNVRGRCPPPVRSAAKDFAKKGVLTDNDLVGFKHVLFSFIFHNILGCHPSHWRTPSFFKIVIAPPTRWMVSVGSDWSWFIRLVSCHLMISVFGKANAMNHRLFLGWDNFHRKAL